MEQVRQYIGEPDALLVTGISAGGFAISLLADDVIDLFSTTSEEAVVQMMFVSMPENMKEVYF